MVIARVGLARCGPGREAGASGSPTAAIVPIVAAVIASIAAVAVGGDHRGGACDCRRSGDRAANHPRAAYASWTKRHVTLLR